MSKTTKSNKIKEKLSRDITPSYIGRVDIINMSVFPSWSIDSKQFQSKLKQIIIWISNKQILKFT